MCRALRLALTLAVLVAVAASAGMAQELRGIVRLADGSAPAVGAIIEAQLPGTGTRVASTLSDARGSFVLALPAGQSVQVRALRIGHRPTVIGSFSLGSGEVRRVEVALTGAAIMLDRVRIVSRQVCGIATDSTLTALTLLDEAQKALRATQLTGSQGELQAAWTLTTRRTTLRGAPVGEVSTREYRGRTSQPFVSLPPDSLATVGYLARTEDEFVYYAPDAEALLSDRFVAGHCFRTEPWTRDSSDWIGLGFEPARSRRDIVGIEGSIWLDRGTAELRRLEFRYVNLPRMLRGTPAGGEVEFLRLASGVWLVRRWSIRMPRPTETEEPTYRAGIRVGSTRTTRVNRMEVTGGEVREIRAARSLLYQADAAGQLTDAPATAASVASVMAELCPSPPAATEGVLWGVVRDSGGAPVAGAGVRVEWPQNARWTGGWRRTWETRRVDVRTDSDGSWLACGAPRGERVEVGLEGSPGNATTLRMPGDVGGLEVNLSHDAPATATGTVAGTVLDSLRGGKPLSGADIRILGSNLRATSDSLGRFTMDGVPSGMHEVALLDDELALLGVPMPTARVSVTGGVAGSVQLTVPAPAALFQSVCGRKREAGEGILVGEVRDLGLQRRSGIPVRATWTRTLVGQGSSERNDHAVMDTTDASGRFALCGLPSDGEVDRSGEVVTFFSGAFRLSAGSAELGSDPVEVRLGGAALSRRDLVIGDARVRGRISGRVLDHLGRPLEGATVVLGGPQGRSVQTSASGAWVLDSVPIRSTVLTIRALRFSMVTRELDPVGGRLTVGDVRLEVAPQVLAASVTTAGAAGSTAARRAEFEERRKTYSFGTFIDDGAIARQPSLQQSYVASRIAKARLSFAQGPGDAGGRGKIGFEVDSGFGAMGLCYPRWFVDGVDFGIPTAAEEQMWLGMAKRLEAYKAALAPAQYNDFNGCGVILIWTR